MKPSTSGREIAKTVLCLVGSTGNGKSHTASLLVGRPGAFKYADGLVSHTKLTERQTDPVNNICVIDTPGFGDHRVSEDEISKIITGIAKEILVYDPDSPVMVNAFLLVQKATPRLSTLKTDLERLVAIFGTVALKSTIILIIQPGEKKPESIFKTAFESEMPSLKALYDSVGAPIQFVLWDNIEPKPEQFAKMRELSTKVPAYTHKTFAQAQEDIKAKTEALLNEMFGEKLGVIEADFAAKQKAHEEEMAKLAKMMEDQTQRTEENLALYKQQQQRAAQLEADLIQAKNNASLENAKAQAEATRAMQDNFKAFIEQINRSNEQMLQSQREDREQRIREGKEAQARFETLMQQKDAESKQIMEKVIEIANRPIPTPTATICEIF